MQKKKEVLFYIFTIISCVLAMTVVVICAILVYDKLQNKQEEKADKEVVAEVEPIIYTKEEVDMMLADAITTTEKSTREKTSGDILGQLQASLENGTTVVESLRPLYKDHIVVVSNGKFHFVPINEDLRPSRLVQENLQILENNEIQYVEDGKVISHKGIDVSRYQGNIDWKQVKESGVEFAIVRLGLRGYGKEGKLSLDEKFLDNVKGANAAGVKVGVYFFTQAITEEEAVEEAEMVLENIKGLKIDLPIVLDVEKTSAKDGRMNQLSVEERTKVVHAFIDRIKESEYTPMIYSNMEMWSVLLNMEEFEDIDKWYAYYTPTIYFPYEYAIWQYSDKGQVPGIEGDVDLNISFKEW